MDDVLRHQRWHESTPGISKIKYPMGSDQNGKIYNLFGIHSKYKRASVRATYIFDSEGVLRAAETHDNRVGRSVSEILRMLAAAIYVQMHADELCPEGWEPGKPTINSKTGTLETSLNSSKRGHK
jgi:peroxiredoxin (alkyl hydroperoxide reductase subunit C)